MAFPSLKKNNVTAFIDLVTTEQSCDYIVKTTKEKVTVPKHTSVQIDCKVQTVPPKEDITLLFEPDINPQWSGKTVVGTLQQVQAVYPTTTLEKPNTLIDSMGPL